MYTIIQRRDFRLWIEGLRKKQQLLQKRSCSYYSAFHQCKILQYSNDQKVILKWLWFH